MPGNWRVRGAALIVLAALCIAAGQTSHVRAQTGEAIDAMRNQLGQLHAMRRFAEAIPIGERYVAAVRLRYGETHIEYAAALSWLAELHFALAQYEQAEPLMKRALAIREAAQGPDHPDVATALFNLDRLFNAQGRSAEADAISKRMVTIREKSPGADQLWVGRDFVRKAESARMLGRYAEAERLSKRGIEVLERTLGRDSGQVAIALESLASLYQLQGRHGEAEPLWKSALAIYEKLLGRNGLDVARPLAGLADLHHSRKQYAEAEPLLKRLLTLQRSAHGDGHPLVAAAHDKLAAHYFVQRDWARAADHWRSSTAVIARRADRGTQAVRQDLTGNRTTEAEQSSWQFWGLVKAAHRLALNRRGETGPALTHETFKAAQWAESSQAASALARMAARGVKGDPGLARIIRQRQDLVVDWQKRDAARTAAMSQPPDKRDGKAEAVNLTRLAAIEATITAIDSRLKGEFGNYAALASPQPLTVEEVQAHLRTDEALVQFLDTPELEPAPEDSFVWVVTRTDARWLRSELGTAALRREVAALRCGLDATAWWKKGSACPRLSGVDYSEADHLAGKPLPFDVVRAHALYKSLLGEAADLIEGKHLLVVPSGALTTLPLQVLVTEPPRSKDPAVARWLIRDHAITVLPSVASLAALRRSGRLSSASKPMIGFGNPLLDGNQAHPRHAAFFEQQAAIARAQTGCAQPNRKRTAALRAVSRSLDATLLPGGRLADLDHLRAQSPLPETADELCEVARSIGADVTDVRIGGRATEKEVKRMSTSGELAQYRLVHFATHGTLAGQLRGTSEPGLILSPPKAATAEDDGYLSGSEIASLRLDADWVILSACNTAGGAGEGESAEALSGLARVFFYAGARALLVSHWEVDSEAAVKLVTGAVSALANAKDKSIGRAEALRRAMLAVTADTSRPANWVPAWHPSVWAPFVVVGEGGVGR